MMRRKSRLPESIMASPLPLLGAFRASASASAFLKRLSPWTWTLPLFFSLAAACLCLRHPTTHFLNIFHRTLACTIMAANRRDSKAAVVPDPKRHMVHLKTKEECRLGNETIQVWTVELPSKHAEGVLKYLTTIPFRPMYVDVTDATTE